MSKWLTWSPGAGKRQSLLDWLDARHFRQAQKEREAYLAQSCDVFELERRMRAMDRGTGGRYC